MPARSTRSVPWPNRCSIVPGDTMISIRRSFVLSVVFTAIVLIFLAACDLQSSSKPAARATAGAAGAPAATALGAAATGAITDFKPWDLRNRDDESIANLLYNGLVRLDESLKPQPDLADHWEVSPNGGIITFTLRSGLTWHDGKPLTSDDVVWTLNSMRALTVTNALLSDIQSTIGQVRSPITGTVVLSLTHAYAPLLADLAAPILPRHQLQTRTIQQLAALNFLDEPLGSGPFKLGDRNEKSINFVRNAQYFRGPPNLDRVTLAITPDAARAAGAVNDGTLLL